MQNRPLAAQKAIFPCFRFCACFLLAFALFLSADCFFLTQHAEAVFGDGANSTPDPILVEIQIMGNTKTSSVYVGRELGLKIGQPLTREQMNDAWDHLEDLGCFAYVDMEFDDFEEGQVTLIINLEEEDTFSYGPLIRFSQRHKYLAGGLFEESNFRGQGETLRADFSAYFLQRARLSWTRPWLFGVNGLQAKIVGQGEQSNFVYRPFRYRQVDLDLALHWNGPDPFFLMGGTNYGSFQNRDDFYWHKPFRGSGTSDEKIVFSAKTQPRLAFWAGTGIDTRSNPFYPSRGIYGLAQIKRWESSHFEPYTEGSIDLRGYFSLPGGKHLLALRAKGRKTNGPAHLNNLCFFGGSQTIRGYQPGSREGDHAYIITAEYRLPLTMMRISPKGDLAGVGLHAFSDAGDAWFDGADPSEALQSFGAGIHFNIERLQIRFEGVRTKDGNWSFEFGDLMTF